MRKNISSEMRRYAATGLALLAIIVCSGFSFFPKSDMPFNGDIVFHDISLTIPRSHIRDSTQSSDDLWIFEKGFYSKSILLSRKDLQGDIDDVLDNYIAYLNSQGPRSERDTFLGLEAVRSAYLESNKPWREMLFVYNDSIYAVATRGGSEEEFLSLLDSVSLNAQAEQEDQP